MSLIRSLRGLVKRPLVAAHRVYMRRAMRLPYCHGPLSRLHLGEKVSAMNTVFNVASGDIFVGDGTIFGHNCMVITGRHDYIGNRRQHLVTGGRDAPRTGFDIQIGSGCWIATGAIISGGVSIGDNTIVGAGAVVTKSLPADVFAAGVPARVIRALDESPSPYWDSPGIVDT
jgi:acetyltransferase-like isoleucine patch superfamily enzyme